VERKLGKFCTVPLATPPQFSLLASSSSNLNFEDQDLDEEENLESEGSVEIEPQKVGTFQQQEMQLLFPHLEIKYT